jgi:hypothetical protein
VALTKEQILALKGSKPESVPIEGYGETFIRVMSGAERDSLEASCIKTRGDKQEQNRDNFRAKILVRAIGDEKGERLFKDEDAGIVGKLPSDYIVPLADVAATKNKLNKKDVEDLTKNSEASPSESSGSDSPAG